MGVAWVNGHWLQIGIAIGAGLVIYLLLSLLRRIALKHAQSTEGDMTLTHIADRKSVVYGKSVSVRVDLGGRRIIKKKNSTEHKTQHHNQSNYSITNRRQ